MTDSIKNGLLRGKSYALLFKDDAAIKDITDAINDLETLATESEQLRKERDGFKLENESLKDFVQIENIMHSMYKGECLELRKENEELKAKLIKVIAQAIYRNS